MSKLQKFCIYCGGPGMSREHLFPDWFKAYVPRELSEHHVGFTVTYPDKTEQAIERKTGDTHSKKIRRVCLSCNTGWMSRLQEEAKPILVPMLQGRQIALRRHEMKILAAWAAMTAMTAEFVQDEMVAIPQGERDYLRENLRVPKTWRIWIGAYDRQNAQKRYWHHVMALTGRPISRSEFYEPSTSNTQTTTICLGDHLFLHMMSSTDTTVKSIIQRWGFPNPISTALKQIHPSAAAFVSWTPAPALSAKGVEIIASDFYRRAERSMYRLSSVI